MSTTPNTSLQFALGQGLQGLILTAANQALLDVNSSGMTDGSTTAKLAKISAEAADFYNWLNAQGDGAWSQGQDVNGNPTFVTNPMPGNTAFQLSVLPTPNAAVVNGSQPPQGFPWEGQYYNIIGSIDAPLTYNKEPVWNISIPLGLIETVPVTMLASVVWSSVLVPIGQAVKTGLQSCLRTAPAVETSEGAGAAADSVAEDAAFDGEVVGDATLDLVTGGVAFVGLLVLFAIPFLIRGKSWTVYHNVQIYNLTSSVAMVNVSLLEDTAMNFAPVGSPPCLLPGITYNTPPGGHPQQMASEANYTLVSTAKHGETKCVVEVNVDQVTFAVQMDVTKNAKELGLSGVDTLRSQSPTITIPPLAATYSKTTPVLSQWLGGVVSLTATFDNNNGHKPHEQSSGIYVANSMIVITATESGVPAG